MMEEGYDMEEGFRRLAKLSVAQLQGGEDGMGVAVGALNSLPLEQVGTMRLKEGKIIVQRTRL